MLSTVFIISVCSECERPYPGDCPIHENIIPIPDTPTTSRSIPNPSVASLPQGTVVRQSRIQHAGLGVFTTCWFQQGSTFGPYRGVRLRADVPKESFDTSYIWEVSYCLCYAKHNLSDSPTSIHNVSSNLERSQVDLR